MEMGEWLDGYKYCGDGGEAKQVIRGREFKSKDYHKSKGRIQGGPGVQDPPPAFGGPSNFIMRENYVVRLRANGLRFSS